MLLSDRDIQLSHCWFSCSGVFAAVQDTRPRHLALRLWHLSSLAQGSTATLEMCKLQHYLRLRLFGKFMPRHRNVAKGGCAPHSLQPNGNRAGEIRIHNYDSNKHMDDHDTPRGSPQQLAPRLPISPIGPGQGPLMARFDKCSSSHGVRWSSTWPGFIYLQLTGY